MAKTVRHVPWDEFLARSDLIGATVETEESVVGGLNSRLSGVIVDVENTDTHVYLIVEGVEVDGEASSRRYEVGGPRSMMEVRELDDGSCRFELPYLGMARVVFFN